MTRLVGALGPFNPSKMQWTSYTERMEEYLLANGVEDDRKKVAIMLSTIGDAAYDLLCDLYDPEKPNMKTFAQLVEKLKEHLQPKPTMISERYRFHQRNQRRGKPIAEYITALRRPAKDCEFGAFLQEAMRDRLACGLSSEAIKKELLKDKDLTLARHVKLPLQCKQQKQTAHSWDEVNSYQQVSGKSEESQARNGPAQKCYRCGKAGHTPDDC